MTDADDDDDDLAAELDDDDYDPTDDDTGDTRDESAPVWHTGTAAGGPPPYDGKTLVSRFPSGILLIDKSRTRAWVYDLDAAAAVFRCRDDAGTLVDDAGRWRAAEGPTYEVRAYDPEFAGDPPPTTAPAGGGGDYDQEPD